MNVIDLISDRFEGSLTELSDEQPSKTSSAISVQFSGSSIDALAVL